MTSLRKDAPESALAFEPKWSANKHNAIPIQRQQIRWPEKRSCLSLRPLSINNPSSESLSFRLGQTHCYSGNSEGNDKMAAFDFSTVVHLVRRVLLADRGPPSPNASDGRVTAGIAD